MASHGWPDHLPYPPDDVNALAPVDGMYLRPEAAAAYTAMARAAREDGVYLVLRSGHRSFDHQSYLFYGLARERGIPLARRARVSAPPGFSEHHTGYAVDIDDGHQPRTFRQSFEDSRAGRWLMANAHRFCFELSFPRGNAQGIAYEPWHWRFIGSPEALATFAAARARYPADPASAYLQRAAVHAAPPRCERLDVAAAPASAEERLAAAAAARGDANAGTDYVPADMASRLR